MFIILILYKVLWTKIIFLDEEHVLGSFSKILASLGYKTFVLSIYYVLILLCRLNLCDKKSQSLQDWDIYLQDIQT